VKCFMYAALGLALASACASAQTDRSRPTATEPVDTIISRFPDQTPARRSLAPAPAAPLAPSESLITQAPAGAATRFVPPPPAAAAEAPARTGVAEAAEEPSRPAPRNVTPRPPRKTATRAPARKAIAHHRAAPPARATRLALSSADRRLVYAAITQQSAFPGMIAPAPAFPSFTWSPQSFPPFGVPQFAGREVATPAPMGPLGYASAGAGASEILVEPTSSRIPTNYVGRRLPSSVLLVPIPDAIVVQMPALWRYRYALVNDRVLLVDPATNIIVADVTQ
jgi:Protein of unknown function (DUF1236)